MSQKAQAATDMMLCIYRSMNANAETAAVRFMNIISKIFAANSCLPRFLATPLHRIADTYTIHIHILLAMKSKLHLIYCMIGRQNFTVVLTNRRGSHGWSSWILQPARRSWTCFSVSGGVLQACKKDCLLIWEGFSTTLGSKFSLLNS